MRDDTLDRMVRAPALVRERLLRATAALQDDGVHYGVIGANAVALYVAARDEGAVRNTPNVDILVNPVVVPDDASVGSVRSDGTVRPGELPDETRKALEGAGFCFVESSIKPFAFLDGPNGNIRQAVRLWCCGDVIKPGTEPLPELLFTLPTSPYRTVSLPCLGRVDKVGAVSVFWVSVTEP